MNNLDGNYIISSRDAIPAYTKPRCNQKLVRGTVNPFGPKRCGSVARYIFILGLWPLIGKCLGDP